MVTLFSAFSANSAKEYSCISCDIKCTKKNDWARHILTQKHIGNTSTTINSAKVDFVCDNCTKIYKSRKGLWSHKKTCISTINDSIENVSQIEEKDKVIELLIKENSEFKNIVLEMVKSNGELQKQMLDVCKNTNSNNVNTINSHNNNKTFNLQFFLNEQCKDAMNISEFVNTFDLQLEDLESVGELGYVEGMTKIIVDKLNSMDIYKRPMHCSDAKRETLYIKDENVWAKEERNNPKLRQAIKTVTFRNMKQVKKWSDKYPESLNNESRLNDKYMMLVIQSTGGNGAITDSENKIIRRITKEIVIGKSMMIQ